MLLRNSARASKKGGKLMPQWKGPYTIHEDQGKVGVLSDQPSN